MLIYSFVLVKKTRLSHIVLHKLVYIKKKTSVYLKNWKCGPKISGRSNKHSNFLRYIKKRKDTIPCRKFSVNHIVLN